MGVKNWQLARLERLGLHRHFQNTKVLVCWQNNDLPEWKFLPRSKHFPKRKDFSKWKRLPKLKNQETERTSLRTFIWGCSDIQVRTSHSFGWPSLPFPTRVHGAFLGWWRHCRGFYQQLVNRSLESLLCCRDITRFWMEVNNQLLQNNQ